MLRRNQLYLGCVIVFQIIYHMRHEMYRQNIVSQSSLGKKQLDGTFLLRTWKLRYTWLVEYIRYAGVSCSWGVDTPYNPM